MVRKDHNSPTRYLRNLRVRISREFALSKIDAAELVDLVAWGKMTEHRLIELLREEQTEEAA